MTYAYEAIFLLFIISIAIYHAKRFAKNIPTGKWFHFLWACFFGFIIAVMWWLSGKNWLLAGSLVIERFVFFNPVLNYFRKPQRAFFYLGAGKNAGWQDRLLSLMRKAYPFIWGACLIGFIILQFFL